jgi:hypothetical protein
VNTFKECFMRYLRGREPFTAKNGRENLTLAVCDKALKGDIRAFELILEMVGESPKNADIAEDVIVKFLLKERYEE